jgi:hypothetical protein
MNSASSPKTSPTAESERRGSEQGKSAPDPENLVEQSPIKGRIGGREFSRIFLSGGAMVLLGLTVYLAFSATKNTSQWDNAKEWLETVLPAETAVLGSAIGFYFGRENTSDRS